MAGGRLILTPQRATVALTRIQSGAGALTIELVCPDSVGDLRLGCAYQLASGHTSTVQPTTGRVDARAPIGGSGAGRGSIRVDLRQVRGIERLAVYGFSESRNPVPWEGTIIATTYGAGRIEAPLESLTPSPVSVLLTAYNVGGELVVRAERGGDAATVRDAARAFGFDQITWIDDRTPVA